MKRFRFDADGDVAADIREKYAFDGDLLDLYASNTGPIVHKWHHYIPIYDRYFSKYRGTPVRFLEIGVNKGGSLQLWRKYFGDDAVIFGIDINEDCAQFDGQAGQVRIGSQADRDFLKDVAEEMGGIDVVLDDGSHRMDHVRFSFRALFPRLNPGGTYMVEDLHTAYMPKFGGGPGTSANFFQVLQDVTQDMHRWYHKAPRNYKGLSGTVSGIHIHDSIAVVEKDPVHRPTHSWVGENA